MKSPYIISTWKLKMALNRHTTTSLFLVQTLFFYLKRWWHLMSSKITQNQFFDVVLHCFSYFNFSCYINTLHKNFFFICHGFFLSIFFLANLLFCQFYSLKISPIWTKIHANFYYKSSDQQAEDLWIFLFPN